MRIETVTRELFQYDELSDAAKEKAREWMRLCQQDDTYWSESVIEEFAENIAPCFGFSVGGRRGNRSVYWSGFSSQGDGVCFAGDWRLSNVNREKLISYLGGDDLVVLGGLISRLIDLFAGEPADDVPCALLHQTGNYSHKYSVRFDCENMTSEQSEAFEDIARDLMDWLYSHLESEYNYQNSDETVVANIEANEYEFTAEGRHA